MDKISYTNTNKQTIYEIYRACRLCGGGAGYKMPIMQNVIDLDNNGIELKQKIEECLQIEVHQDDKMPPLICELCVDKVNDFYDFMEMCKQTNKRTRLRLGLPLRTAVKRSTTDSGDCILGVTEPIHDPDEDDNVPLSAQMKPKKKEIKKEKEDEPLSKSVKKKELKRNVKEEKKKEKEFKTVENKVKAEKPLVSQPESRRSRTRLSPPRGQSEVSKISGSKSTNKSSEIPASTSHPVSRRELRDLLDVKDEEPLKMKRVREKEPVLEKKVEKPEVPVKKVKIASPPTPRPKPKSKRVPSHPPETPTPTSKTPAPTSKTPTPTSKTPTPTSKTATTTSKTPTLTSKTPTPTSKTPTPTSKTPTPKSKTPAPTSKTPTPAPTPPPQYECSVCGLNYKTAQGRGSHVKNHVATFTSDKLACNPCGEWFATSEESSVHHKRHKNKPYRCRHCSRAFKLLADYDGHFIIDNCRPFTEVPDKKCPECWRQYPTQLMLDRHRCQGVDGRPGGKCMKCNRMYTLLKNLKKHEATCNVRKKGDAIVDPEVEKRLRLTQILVMNCDDLLHKTKGDSYDVSELDSDYGFDYKYIYPYRYRVKSEPTTGYDTMVAIGDEVKEYYARDFIHWDSDDTDAEIDDKTRRVDSLTTISLKTIFSNKLIGKVPRKRRKINDKLFDNTDFDMSKDIDSIIGNLDVDIKTKNDSANDSDCSESIFGPFKDNDVIPANAFDSLLTDNDSQDTEKNFALFNTSGENKDSSTDGTKKVDDSGSLNNDKESENGINISDKNKDSCNDEIKKVNDSVSLNNDKESDINSSAENKDSSNDLEKVNDSGSLNNDKDNGNHSQVSNDDSGVKNDEFDKSNEESAENYHDLESNDKTNTNYDVNEDENVTQNKKSSELENNEVTPDDKKEEITTEDTNPYNVNENDKVDKLELNSTEQIRLGEDDVITNSADLVKDKLDVTVENNDVLDSKKSQDSTESNLELSNKVNGQTDEKILNDVNDSEIDDKKLMDALDAEIDANVGNGNRFSEPFDNKNEESNRNVDFEPKIDTNFSNGNLIRNDSIDDSFKMDFNNTSNVKPVDFIDNNAKIIDNIMDIDNGDVVNDQKDKILSDFESKKQDNLVGMDLDTVSDEEFQF